MSEVLAAIARRDALFLRVRQGRLLDDRTQQRTVGLHPVADHVPLLAVPLLEAHGAAAFMIRAGQLERLDETECAELFQARIVEIQMLEAPAHLLARERL